LIEGFLYVGIVIVKLDKLGKYDEDKKQDTKDYRQDNQLAL
jgi:hypothetical protein